MPHEMIIGTPTAADVPPLELHHLETPAPSIAGGFKGAGEAGTDYQIVEHGFLEF